MSRLSTHARQRQSVRHIVGKIANIVAPECPEIHGRSVMCQGYRGGYFWVKLMMKPIDGGPREFVWHPSDMDFDMDFDMEFEK